MRMLAASVLAVTLGAAGVSAHHGKDRYEPTPITVRGTVVESIWVNPHVQVVLEVRNQDGSVGKWKVDLSPPNAMRRSGLDRDSVKVGTVLTIEGYPAADRTAMTARSFTFADGRTKTTNNEFFRPLDSKAGSTFTPAPR